MTWICKACADAESIGGLECTASSRFMTDPPPTCLYDKGKAEWEEVSEAAAAPSSFTCLEGQEEDIYSPNDGEEIERKDHEQE